MLTAAPLTEDLALLQALVDEPGEASQVRPHCTITYTITMNTSMMFSTVPSPHASTHQFVSLQNRARMYEAALRSDMSAFRAVNLGCVLADFVRCV
jgi:hypothetical protein